MQRGWLVMWQVFSVFSFFDSSCLRHRVLHNGSFCQLPEGEPSVLRSTSGYSTKRACILSNMSFPGDIILRKCAGVVSQNGSLVISAGICITALRTAISIFSISLNIKSRSFLSKRYSMCYKQKTPRTIWALLRRLARADNTKVRLLFVLCKSLGRKVMIWWVFLTVVECLEGLFKMREFNKQVQNYEMFLQKHSLVFSLILTRCSRNYVPT